MLVWVSQGDGALAAGWWEALAAAALGSGDFELPQSAGVCDGHTQVPLHPTPTGTGYPHTAQKG